MKAFEGLRNNVVEPTLGRISEGVEGAVREILNVLVHAVDSDPRDTIRREARILPGRVGDAAREVVSIADEAAFRLATELWVYLFPMSSLLKGLGFPVVFHRIEIQYTLRRLWKRE